MFFCRKRIRHQAAKKGLEQGEIETRKCCGSSRPSGKCACPHYAITTYGPDKMMRQYKLRALLQLISI
jgi:hypothetical protein